jgi:ATP-dependent DNA helicase RecG
MKKRESPFQHLDKMLSLELRQHCADQLVIGGLAAYVTQRWQHEADADISNDDDRARVARITENLASYSSLSPDQRHEAIMSCRSILRELMAQPQAGEPAAQMPADKGQTEKAGEQPEPTADLPVMEPHVIRTVARPPRPAAAPRAYGLDASVTTLSGVSAGYAARLGRLGVHTVRDLLYLFPRRYNDFSHMKRIADLQIGAVETVVGTVWEVNNVTGRNGKVRTEALINDETGTIRAVWFNQPYMSNNMPRGQAVVLSGRIDVYLGRKVMESPEYELLETDDLLHTGRLVPIYPLTEGIGARWMRRLQKRVVDRWASHVVDYLPSDIRNQTGLPDLSHSLAQMHFPDSLEELERARRRLAFDELFLIQMGLMQRRRAWRQGIIGTPLRMHRDHLEQMIAALPFALTPAQRRVLQAILDDIGQAIPMARLLQGDVGSGKTVVALLAMLVVIANGYQAAMMAPTEILARQHFKTIVSLLIAIGRRLADEANTPLLDELDQAVNNNDLPDLVTIPPIPFLPAGVRLARLIGSLSESGKQAVREALAAGNVDIVVGTHALIEESVSFDRLGLAVIDEQHRFGVMQRATLRQKGYNPHVLVMTATPIPRTLALTMYGDLDISVIDELPPGRQIVKTKWLEQRDRERAYTFIRRQIEQGHQAFVICPLIEESEVMETKAAVEEYERLKTEVFPDLRVGLVHGRLRSAEKDETMARFARGELDILVATAVVEVGIDVPNATVMLIEGANHFGLAQLHQFRGRVGRGKDQSYCILLSDESRVLEDNPRLLAVEQTHDGFKLAEIDLEIRGMGEFFGTRQSGLPDLRVARLSDTAILELAREQAHALFEKDPDLTQPEHQALAQKVATFWQKPAGEGDVS